MPALPSRGYPAVFVALVVVSALAPAAGALESSVASVRVTGSPSVASTFPTLDGSGVVVAVLDTGVDNEHETFRGAYVAGIDVSLPPAPLGGGHASQPCSDPDDREGHGTHVAGILLGRGDATGVHRGVAPGARLVDVKVAVDFTSTAVAGLVRGLQWVLDYNAGRTTCHPAEAARIHVVSVSFGGTSPGDASDDASRLVDALAESGVVVVASAGNCGPDATPGIECAETGPNTIASPAVARGAIAVAAADDKGTPDRGDDEIAAYSSRGPNGAEPKPNVAAPGSSITSAAYAPLGGGASGWTEKSGTSMATPHVSGVAALLLQAAPALKPGDVKAILQATAEDRGTLGWDASWGAGYVDGLAAASRALGRVNAKPVVEVATSCDVLACTLDASRSSDPEGGALAFEWSFGDGQVGSGARAAHTYAGPGEWLVSLTVRDAEGARATWSRALALELPVAPAEAAPEPRANAPPAAVATVTPREGPPGTRFAFDATASSDDDGRIVSYRWDVDGDGNPDGEGATFSWAPTREGVHVVRVVVSDDAEAVAIATLTVLVDSASGSGAAGGPGDGTPPALQVLSPQAGAVLTSPFTVRWFAYDEAGAPTVTLFVDGARVAESTLDSAVVRAKPGAHTLLVRVEDAAGNAVEERIDFSVPSTESEAPEAPSPATIRVINAGEVRETGAPPGPASAGIPAPGAALAGLAAALAAVVLARRRA